MSDAEERGPADLGQDTMPDTENRNPPTRHGETGGPGDEDKGIGGKVKNAVSGAVDRAKGMLGGGD